MPDTSLLNTPLWTDKDTGKRLPDAPYATSVCLPTWDSVGQYIAEAPKLMKKLQSDYPRFGFHPLVQQLHEKCDKEFGKKDMRCIAFPSEESAERAQEFVIDEASAGLAEDEEPNVKLTIHDVGANGVHAVCVEEKYFETARLYREYTGEIVSARLAEATLGNKELSAEEVEATNNAKNKLRKQISELTGEEIQNIALFPTGISALATVQRFLQISFPDRKSVQFGYCYTDPLKLHEKFGNGTHYFPKGDKHDFSELEELLKKEKVLGIFCDLPGNPLLQENDLQRLHILSKKYTVPIIVDDTIGTFQNMPAFAFADIVVSSLTKFFCGSGNVSGGALVLHSESRFVDMFRRVARANFEDLLWGQDAVALAEDAADFEQRIEKVEENREKLCAYLENHNDVYRIFVPEFQTPIESVTSGGIFSLLLYNPEVHTPRFYDAMRVCKGPNFGLYATMLFPYLEMIADPQMSQQHGISPYLLRVSVGTEDADDLIARFETALKKMKEVPES